MTKVPRGARHPHGVVVVAGANAPSPAWRRALSWQVSSRCRAAHSARCRCTQYLTKRLRQFAALTPPPPLSDQSVPEAEEYLSWVELAFTYGLGLSIGKFPPPPLPSSGGSLVRARL
jgi:hypothetical protein